MYDTADATANSRINARLPYIFLLSRIAHYPATFKAGGADNTSQYLLGLAGLGIPGCAQAAGTPLSRFLALLPVMMLPGRTAEGMGALVRLLAPDTRTQVYHHDRCRIPLKQPVAMSTCQPVSLKHRPVMGTHATDVNGQVLLRLSTDNPEEIRGWLPGGDLHADLMALLHVWLGAHLDVRMQLCVARHLLPDARLSCNAEQIAQVGRTAVLRPLNPQQNRNDIITIHPGRFQRVRENIQRRKNDEDGDYRW
ncbi:type VI secretion system baseplate subunit TssG [Enterobacter hormaechei]|nr:type VI secretion system baseplate subunit TssG [Enterobacter hormaechei]